MPVDRIEFTAILDMAALGAARAAAAVNYIIDDKEFVLLRLREAKESMQTAIKEIEKYEVQNTR